MSYPVWIGFLRSLVIYYALPWRRIALRRFYKQLLPANALVFDVGAHVGSRTKTILGIGGRSIVIEPQPVFARWLRFLFRDNPHVELVEAAVGREQGTLTLQISSRYPTVSTLSKPWMKQVEATPGFAEVSWDQEIDVPVTTVDQLIEHYGRPDFLKIDVEGFEPEILRGCSTPIALVAVEYIPAAIDLLWQCIERLEALGDHEYNVVVGETHQFELSRWVAAKEVREIIENSVIRGSSGDLYARNRLAQGCDEGKGERAIQ